MEVLVLAAGGVVSVADLSRRVWGQHSFAESERVSKHITRIRKKLESSEQTGDFVLSVRGEGYRLVDEPFDRTIDLNGLG